MRWEISVISAVTSGPVRNIKPSLPFSLLPRIFPPPPSFSRNQHEINRTIVQNVFRRERGDYNFSRANVSLVSFLIGFRSVSISRSREGRRERDPSIIYFVTSASEIEVRRFFGRPTLHFGLLISQRETTSIVQISASRSR